MLLIQEEKVYEKLYDIVEENLTKAGKRFTPAKSVFLISTKLEPQKTNLELLKDIEKKDFIQAAYFAVLRRMPDEDTVEHWKNMEIYNSADYKKTLVRTVVYSLERKIKNIEVYNTETFGLKRCTRMDNILIDVYGMAYKMYAKLPKSMRGWIKKVIKR